ncbi:MAG: hypothetical protein RL367_1570 [Pseudomonadota bacterium]
MIKLKQMVATALVMTSVPAMAIDASVQRAAAVPESASNMGGTGGRGMGILGCSASGGKQVPGAVIGGVLGGFLGNRIAGGGSRTLGTLLGAGLGAAAGSAIGCHLQKNDQIKAERAMQDALAKNENQSWKSEDTGASGTVEVGKTAAVGADLGGLSFAKGVEPASGYTRVGASYVTSAAANVRSAPGMQGNVLGQLPAGTRVWVPASVNGAPWFLVAQDGVGRGYVSNALLTKAKSQTAASGCKTVKQTVDLPGEGTASETYQACKAADGQWTMTRV